MKMKRYVVSPRLHVIYIYLLASIFLIALPGCVLDDAEDDSPNETDPTCEGASCPQASRDIQLERFTSITFRLPIVMHQAPGNDALWYIGLKGGEIHSFDNASDAEASRLVLDIADRVDSGPNEAGLLGMAFDPDFQSNGFIYVSYTAPGLVSTISRFTSDDNGLSINPDSEQIILTLPQPRNNHNGGNIGFGSGPGAGKYMYIAFGDGGGGGDPDGDGQNTNTLLGAMLRIDVDVSESDWNSGIRYYIPADNPFSESNSCNSGEGCPEIFAWGLRNPWSWSFDKQTGALWAGDVGQNAWEEINRIDIGGNYGWNIREGKNCFNGEGCETTGLIDPVIEYSLSGGNCSVTGGYVYRGAAIPGLQGEYIYGDFCSGSIWSFDINDSNPEPKELITTTPYSISGFAQDSSGELYLLNYGASGTIQRIIPRPE